MSLKKKFNLCLIGAFGLLILSIFNLGFPFAVFLCLAFASFLLILSGCYDSLQGLAREADLTRVTLKGESTFKATIIITYKDGKLMDVQLAENTTHRLEEK